MDERVKIIDDHLSSDYDTFQKVLSPVDRSIQSVLRSILSDPLLSPEEKRKVISPAIASLLELKSDLSSEYLASLHLEFPEYVDISDPAETKASENKNGPSSSGVDVEKADTLSIESDRPTTPESSLEQSVGTQFVLTPSLKPVLPFCLITFNKSELLSYARQFAAHSHRCSMFSSRVINIVPVQKPPADPSSGCLLVKRESTDLGHSPLAELVTQEHKTAGYLIPVVKSVLSVPNAIMTPVKLHALDCQFYSLHIPLQAVRTEDHYICLFDMCPDQVAPFRDVPTVIS